MIWTLSPPRISILEFRLGRTLLVVLCVDVLWAKIHGNPGCTEMVIKHTFFLPACIHNTQFLDSDQIDHYVKQIEKAREEEAERRKAKKTTTSSAPA